ncbi:MAG TPA: hypothetical protein VIO11_08770 [Candidatus Methanoperedens sp.]
MVQDKIKDKITKFKKNIILNFVQFEDWFEIRSDFLQIYNNGINSEKIKKESRTERKISSFMAVAPDILKYYKINRKLS